MQNGKASLEAAKRIAAYRAVDDYIKVKIVTKLHLIFLPIPYFMQDNSVIGIGSGSTIVYAVERLGKYLPMQLNIFFSMK